MIELSVQSKFDAPLVIGLGFFDCLHAGHRRILFEVVKIAAELQSIPCLSTFSNNPYRMFNSDARVINTYSERTALFELNGITHILPFVFDSEFKRVSKDSFLDALFNAFNIRALVCGYDYLFGYKGEGDAEYLKQYAKARGAAVVVVEPVILDGVRVSSTGIKELLEEGEIERANRYLVSPFFMRGIVARGHGKGATINFPTANLLLKKSKLLPPDGVYKTRTTINDKVYPSATHIGPRPTFAECSRSVETHIEGIFGELYGQEITVEFLKKLRNIKKFSSLNALANQICKDLGGE